MSQQINLFNPALRKQREWLSLPVIAAAFALVLVVELLAFVWYGRERGGLQTQLTALQAQSRQLQEDVQSLVKLMPERQANPALTKEVERTAESLRQYEEVFKALETASADGGQGFAPYFMAFSRQAIEGVWLTGFTINSRTMEIRGRVLDGALLPAYIRRLDAEANFHGRKFAALDMKGVEPKPLDPAAGAKPATSAGSKPERPYIDFVLQGVGIPAAQGGAQ